MEINMNLEPTHGDKDVTEIPGGFHTVGILRVGRSHGDGRSSGDGRSPAGTAVAQWAKAPGMHYYILYVAGSIPAVTTRYIINKYKMLFGAPKKGKQNCGSLNSSIK
jgi:hypothetical protein